MALDKKLTLSDLPSPQSHGIGLWTCGISCLDPRACLAAGDCKRGFVSNAVGYSSRPSTLETLETQETLEGEQHAKRDAAWQSYCANCRLRDRYNDIAIGAMHDAFNAGWAARKKAELEKAELEMAFGLDRPKAK